MKRSRLIKVNATLDEYELRRLRAESRGMSLSKFMLVSSSHEFEVASLEDMLMCICKQEEAALALRELAARIAEEVTSPLGLQLLFEKLTDIEAALRAIDSEAKA